MDDKEKTEYLERLTKILRECLTTHEGSKHALLIVANDETESLSIFTVNADEDILTPLVTAAQQIVEVHTETGKDRVLN